jgi:Arc/MetJ family transcription regulator
MDEEGGECISCMHRWWCACILLPGGKTMRTTLDLPDRLMQDAMKASHQKTKTAVIIAALQDFVRKSRLQELRAFKGQVELDVDLDALRKRA